MKKYFTGRRIAKLLENYPNGIKLNIGCGTDYKDGWINIDNNSDHNITKVDLMWDLRNPLPFTNNSVDYIFNEHFMEHLTPKEAQIIIKDLFRVLRPGGVLRIAMPDLEWVVNNYFNLPIKKDPTLKKFNLSHIRTRAERINMSFSSWGHKWLYDWEEMERRFDDWGIKKYKRCEWHKSKHPLLRDLEIREESLLIAEVTK